MKFSTIAALCVAPLALAGSFDFDGLSGLQRREDIIVESSETTASDNSNGKGPTNPDTKSNKGNSNSKGNSGSSSTSTEIIIIWVNNGGGAATSTVNTPAVATAAAAAAATHSVVVGGTAGLVYTPDTITAAVGDMVIFEFQSQNHTATQSAFTSPCVALEGGTDSGFMANPNNSVSPAPQMAMQVTVATPIWFYCKQVGHCGKGMTFSINPTANKTQAMFQQMAIAQNGTGSTAGIAASASAAAAATTLSTATASGAVASSTGTVVSGSGTDASGGACTCSCLCGVQDFPNSAIQGIAAFGGLSGSMPLSALEA